MPRAPSKLRYLRSAKSDIGDIKQKNPGDAERIFKKITEWEDKIGWGRAPQSHLTYLTGSGSYNFYREYVGKSGYRIIYEISNDVMTVVAVREKDVDTYNINKFSSRMDREG